MFSVYRKKWADQKRETQKMETTKQVEVFTGNGWENIRNKFRDVIT